MRLYFFLSSTISLYEGVLLRAIDTWYEKYQEGTPQNVYLFHVRVPACFG